MKGSIRAGLIVVATWVTAFVIIGAAASVCSSCGGKAAASSRANCH
jgi:hypothetical protein